MSLESFFGSTESPPAFLPHLTLSPSDLTLPSIAGPPLVFMVVDTDLAASARFSAASTD